MQFLSSCREVVAPKLALSSLQIWVMARPGILNFVFEATIDVGSPVAVKVVRYKAFANTESMYGLETEPGRRAQLAKNGGACVMS